MTHFCSVQNDFVRTDQAENVARLAVEEVEERGELRPAADKQQVADVQATASEGKKKRFIIAVFTISSTTIHRAK